jgi:hypothetical protein
VARLPLRWSFMMALRIGSSPPHPSSSHQPTGLQGFNFRASEPLLVLWASGVQNTVFYSWWKLTPLFQVPSTTIVVSFPHIPSQQFCNKFKLSFTFIDLFLQVHLHHIFILMSFAIVLGQFSYIYNLGETGCYNSLPLKRNIVLDVLIY